MTQETQSRGTVTTKRDVVGRDTGGGFKRVWLAFAPCAGFACLALSVGTRCPVWQSRVCAGLTDCTPGAALSLTWAFLVLGVSHLDAS